MIKIKHPPSKPTLVEYKDGLEYFKALEDYADNMSEWVKVAYPHYVKYHEALSGPDAICMTIVRVLNQQRGNRYTLQMIKAPGRMLEVIIYRHAMYYYLRQFTRLGLVAIGKYFNHRHHSTVIHGIREWENRIQLYKEFTDLDKKIMEALEA